MASRMLGQWNAWFDSASPIRPLSILRIAVGPLVIVHLRPFLARMAAGEYYRGAFYSPWSPYVPEVPRDVYFALMAVCVVAAVCLMIGLRSRLASLYCFGFVTWNFFLNQLHFHNNRTLLVLVLGSLVLTPCGNELSVDAILAKRRGRPLPTHSAPWPMMLLRFEAVSMYLGSGGSKLFEPDWRSGIVTWDRVLRYRDRIEASIAPSWFVDVLANPTFHSWFAKIAIATELFVGIGLVFSATRYPAVFVAFWFHLVIGVGLEVDIFSWLAVTLLLVWSSPDLRDRSIRVDIGTPARRLTVMVKYLDWLARFRIEPQIDSSASVTLVERSGTVRSGREAVAFALLRLPPLFPVVAPFAVLVRRGGRAPDHAAKP